MLRRIELLSLIHSQARSQSYNTEQESGLPSTHNFRKHQGDTRRKLDESNVIPEGTHRLAAGLDTSVYSNFLGQKRGSRTRQHLVPSQEARLGPCFCWCRWRESNPRVLGGSQAS